MRFKLLATLLLACAVSAMAQGGYQDGIDYYNVGRLDEARIILGNTLNDASTNKSLSYYYLGCIDLREGKVAEANTNFQNGISADPSNPYNYIGVGEVALIGGDKKAAETSFKEAEKYGKKDAAVSATIARAYYNAAPDGRYAKEVEKYIQRGFKESKYSEPAVYMLQADMIASSNAGEAAGLYEMAINQGQERGGRIDPAPYVKYAHTYFRINPEFAINKLVELNKLQPTSALAQRELAEKYYENNQLTMAADQYGKYMRNPNHFQRDEQRYCGLLFFGKKYDESLQVANKVLSQDPENFYMWRMKMYNLYELKKYDEALAAGEHLMGIKGADLNYKDYDVYGDILGELKRPQEAIQAYDRAMTLNPDKTDILMKVSEMQADAQQYSQAAATMQRYVDAGNTTTNDLYVLARRYFESSLMLPEGSPERAAEARRGVEYIDKALEKAPEQGTLWRTKAQLLQAIDPTITPEVAQCYEKVIDCYLAEPDGKVKRASALKASYSVLASYYLTKGDKATARGYFEKYLELAPDDTDVRNYLKNL